MAACATLFSSPAARAVQAQAIPPSRLQEGTLSFDGRATAGDFVGTTHTVRGEHTGGARLTDIHGWVEAPVATLKTGNDRRDRDLNKSMESDRYPTLRFDLTRVVPVEPQTDPPASDTAVGVMLEGALTIHGVRREVAIPARLRFEGATTRVKADFPLNLKDYRIGGLSKVLGLLKMDKHTVVHVDLVFSPEAP